MPSTKLTPSPSVAPAKARSPGASHSHSRAGALVFGAKAAVHRLGRAARDLRGGPRRHPRGTVLEDAPVLAESVSALWTEDGLGELPLVAGKVRNLRLAARRIHGAEILAGAVFGLREALAGLDVELVAMGSKLEGADFWKGVRIAAPEAHWLDGADIVVFPTFVENQPRRLLAALAAGVPVIATLACGLGPREGLTLVSAGNAAALREALEAVLAVRAAV